MGTANPEGGPLGRPMSQWLGALAIIAGGCFFAIEAASYGFGSGFRIGPGVFPLATGLLLIVLGCAVALERRPEPAEATFGLRPLLSILVGIGVFGLLIDRAGLYAATFALILVSGLGDRTLRSFTLLASALALSVIGHLIFIVGLGMPIEPY